MHNFGGYVVLRKDDFDLSGYGPAMFDWLEWLQDILDEYGIPCSYAVHTMEGTTGSPYALADRATNLTPEFIEYFTPLIAAGKSEIGAHIRFHRLLYISTAGEDNTHFGISCATKDFLRQVMWGSKIDIDRAFGAGYCKTLWAPGNAGSWQAYMLARQAGFEVADLGGFGTNPRVGDPQWNYYPTGKTDYIYQWANGLAVDRSNLFALPKNSLDHANASNGAPNTALSIAHSVDQAISGGATGGGIFCLYFHGLIPDGEPLGAGETHVSDFCAIIERLLSLDVQFILPRQIPDLMRYPSRRADRQLDCNLMVNGQLRSVSYTMHGSTLDIAAPTKTGTKSGATIPAYFDPSTADAPLSVVDGLACGYMATNHSNEGLVLVREGIPCKGRYRLRFQAKRGTSTGNLLFSMVNTRHIPNNWYPSTQDVTWGFGTNYGPLHGYAGSVTGSSIAYAALGSEWTQYGAGGEYEFEASPIHRGFAIKFYTSDAAAHHFVSDVVIERVG